METTKRIAFLITLFMMINYCGCQTVDCMRFINNFYTIPSVCTSTTSDNRPINATATINCVKNTEWYGADDWNPYLIRNTQAIAKLVDLPNCFGS